MRNTTIILTTISILLPIGCGTESPEPPTPDVKAVTPAGAIDNAHEAVATSPSEVTKTLAIAGNTFRVLVKGSLTPNAVLDVSIVQSTGTPAAAIRVWIGDESGVGSLKIKVHSHGTSSHAHAKAPAKLPENSALWIEVQNVDGTSGSGSIQLVS